MSVEQIHAINEQLSNLLQKKDYTNPDLKKHIRNQKLMIYAIPNLHNQPANLLNEARTFAELNLFWCLVSRASRDFELAIEKVRFFYENGLSIPRSINHQAIKSIHLLSLLSANRNEEFYSKLENLPVSQLENNLVGFVLKLNDAIEEGNYRKVFTLKKQSPLQYFAPFLEKIEDTIRIQIAKSAEKAYTILSMKQALQIFQMNNQNQLKTFIEKYTGEIEEPSVNWHFSNDQIRFQRLNTQKIKFNSDELIKTSLFYAEELEKIA